MRTSKALKRKKLKIPEVGKTSHVHRLAELIS
jgi:hypothetical protein